MLTLPQYFQGVLGTDAMGSGLRLLLQACALRAAAPASSRRRLHRSPCKSPASGRRSPHSGELVGHTDAKLRFSCHGAS